MLKFYYRWRYNRAQRISSFEVPKRSHSSKVHLGSYLSQDTVRGRHFDRFDLPRKRGRWLRALLLCGAIVLFIWVIYESIHALSLMSNG